MHVLRAIPVRVHVQHPRGDRIGSQQESCTLYAIVMQLSSASQQVCPAGRPKSKPCLYYIILYCMISCDNTADILYDNTSYYIMRYIPSSHCDICVTRRSRQVQAYSIISYIIVCSIQYTIVCITHIIYYYYDTRVVRREQRGFAALSRRHVLDGWRGGRFSSRPNPQ